MQTKCTRPWRHYPGTMRKVRESHCFKQVEEAPKEIQSITEYCAEAVRRSYPRLLRGPRAPAPPSRPRSRSCCPASGEPRGPGSFLQHGRARSERLRAVNAIEILHCIALDRCKHWTHHKLLTRIVSLLSAFQPLRWVGHPRNG